MNKKILVLGAGEAQLNLIKCSKELGYYTIVCDMRPEMEGSRIADRYYRQDYMDREAILKIACDEAIDGAISNSEPAMSSISYLVDQLKIPGNSMQSIERLMSKEKFRLLQQECKVYSPKSYTVDSASKLDVIVPHMNFPVLIKPVESSGTRGVTKLYNDDSKEMKKAFDICRDFSRNNLVAIEEYVEMPKLEVYQADIFIEGKTILWDGLFTTKRAARMPFVPMTHVFPLLGTTEEEIRLKDCVEKIIHASGVSLGEFNVEAYFTSDGKPFVIEINVRQGGNHIPQLIQKHTGVDLTKLLVTTSVGDRSYLETLSKLQRKNDLIMMHMIFPDKAGIYRGIHIAKELTPFITDIKEEVCIGDKIEKNDNAEDVLAYVFFKFDSRDLQIKVAENAEKYMFACIE